MDNQELARTIGGGLLSFPVAHFTAEGELNEPSYRDHLSWLLLSSNPRASSPPEEPANTSPSPSTSSPPPSKPPSLRVAGKVPVLAGCGYGTIMATQFAKAAEAAGADGILLFPPYLINADPEGLIAHVKAVCAATTKGVIFYNRDNAIINATTLARMADLCPNLIGFKDGVGDIDLMTRIYSKLGDRLTYVGGLPTAETFALPYLEMGVTTYSSAIFNFLPKFAMDFYAAVRRRDHAHVARELRDFVIPYIEIRDRRKGYAVSIVKAGMKVIGRDAGPVRTPLTDLTEEELALLSKLMAGRS